MAESLWMMGKGYHYTYTTRAPDGVNFQNSKNKVYGPRLLLVMILGIYIHTYLSTTRNQPEKCVWVTLNLVGLFLGHFQKPEILILALG